MPIDNVDEFYAERADLIAQKEAADKRFEEVQAQTQELTLDTQLEAAYRELGGIGNDDDREAYEAIKRHLEGSLRFEDGRPVFFDERGVIEFGADGPKTVAEKVAELKQHPTYKQFFSADTNSPQANNSQPKIYSRQDARDGKASIEDIAFGRASVENSSGVPDFVPHTKKVNVNELAKLKSRTWK